MRKLLTAAVAVLAVICDSAHAEDLLERGAYLMTTIVACGNCHTPVGPAGPGPELSGGLPFESPGFIAFAANITPDVETGIGDWSDEEIARAIREGIGRDGRLLAPVMPAEFYQHLSDRDLASIIAYLRRVEPVRNEVPKTAFNMELPPAWVAPVAMVPEPDYHTTQSYGAYLAEIGHCMECHTPRNEQGQLDMERMGAGGQQFPGPWGVTVSANITSDREAGIGGWSEEEIKRAITRGISRDGSQLQPPMAYAYYDGIAEEDLKALIAWLRSVPPHK